jgi:hypothetical protein
MTTTLTPTLSHPMGEGEPFTVLSAIGAPCFPDNCWNNTKRPIVIPSPIGWERVRVRASVLLTSVPHCALRIPQ